MCSKIWQTAFSAKSKRKKQKNRPLFKPPWLIVFASGIRRLVRTEFKGARVQVMGELMQNTKRWFSPRATGAWGSQTCSRWGEAELETEPKLSAVKTIGRLVGDLQEVDLRFPFPSSPTTSSTSYCKELRCEHRRSRAGKRGEQSQRSWFWRTKAP